VAVDGLVRLHESAFICMICLSNNHSWNAKNFTYNLSARKLVAMHLNVTPLSKVELKGVVDEPVSFGTVAGLASFADVVSAQIATPSSFKPVASSADLYDATIDSEDVEPFGLFLVVGLGKAVYQLNDGVSGLLSLLLPLLCYVFIQDNGSNELKVFSVNVIGKWYRLLVRDQLDPFFCVPIFVEFLYIGNSTNIQLLGCNNFKLHDWKLF